MEIKTLTSTLALTVLLTGTAAIAMIEAGEENLETKSPPAQMQKLSLESQFGDEKDKVPMGKGWVETLSFGYWGKSSTSPTTTPETEKKEEPQIPVTTPPETEKKEEPQTPVTTPLEIEKKKEEAIPNSSSSLGLQNDPEVTMVDDLLTRSYLSGIQDPEALKNLLKIASNIANEEDKQKAKKAATEILADAQKAKNQKQNKVSLVPVSLEEKNQLSLIWRLLGY